MSIEEVRELIKAFGDKECGHGVTSQEIADTENELGGFFPQSYKRFLRQFGWARFRHEELYGLGSGVPAYLELVRNTVAERFEMQPSLRPSLIPIMNDGAGNHFCLDTSRTSDCECPVVFWDHEQGADQEPETVSETFDGWLIDLLHRLLHTGN
jgi:cell wall assembly regulator SMI1